MTEPWYRAAVAGPATHVLAIGVSAYPYKPLGLGDLPGSATSAARFATWMRDSYRRPAAPVGSIRLLLAPSAKENSPVSAGTRVPLPTRANVLQALAEWQHDCMTSPENIAVLYISGHGVQETDDGGVVLVHDAGVQHASPLDEAFDVYGVRQGLRGPASPTRQWYFADACRLPEKSLDMFEGPVHGGITLPARRGSGPPHRPVYFAAEPGRPAYQSEQGTIFLRALLQCLDLDAIVRRPQTEHGWAVDGTSLLTNLRRLVPALAARGLADQPVNFGGSMTDEVFTETSQPQVPVTLRILPPQVQELPSCGAEIIEGRTLATILPRRSLPLVAQPVPAGFWTLAVTFSPAHPTYSDRPGIALPVLPPAYEEEVQPWAT